MKYMDDVNNITTEIVNSMTHLLKKKEIVLTMEEENKVWNCIQSVLEGYCETGEYKNHN